MKTLDNATSLFFFALKDTILFGYKMNVNYFLFVKKIDTLLYQT